MTFSFRPGTHSLVISRQEVFTVGTFIFTAGIIVAFGEALHRAHRREQSSGQNLVESEATIPAHRGTANEGIWILDAEAKVSFVNPRMAQMLGYSPEEMIGRHKWDFVFPGGCQTSQGTVWTPTGSGFRKQWRCASARKRG